MSIVNTNTPLIDGAGVSVGIHDFTDFTDALPLAMKKMA